MSAAASTTGTDPHVGQCTKLRGREPCVAVGADPVERDVAEVEEPGEADSDVQPQREQRVDEGDRPDADDVVVRRHRRDEGGDPEEEQEECPTGEAVELALHAAGEPAIGLRPLVRAGDPLVDADAGSGWLAH
jgi:hypothetical protein